MEIERKSEWHTADFRIVSLSIWKPLVSLLRKFSNSRIFRNLSLGIFVPYTPFTTVSKLPDFLARHWVNETVANWFRWITWRASLKCRIWETMFAPNAFRDKKMSNHRYTKYRIRAIFSNDSEVKSYPERHILEISLQSQTQVAYYKRKLTFELDNF